MGTKEIRQAMKKAGKTLPQMAQAFGIPYQTFANRLQRNTWTVADLKKIADILGYKVAFIKDDEQIIID